MLQREYFGIEMLGNLPFPYKLAIPNFPDSIGIGFAVRGLLQKVMSACAGYLR